MAPYPATTTQWLIRLLELLTSIVNCNEDFSQVVVTEAEYHQLLEFLDDLICSVGEDEKHSLTATMTLIGGLIKAYEDQHFPKLNTLFPELTAELSESVSVETNGKNSDAPAHLSGQIKTDFVIVLYSLGCLLWTGGQSDQAISAYDLAISAECKYITSSDNDAYIHEPLKSFLCATDTLFGIFAPSINPDSWIFYENLRHNRFRLIKRSDFEEQVVATSE